MFAPYTITPAAPAAVAMEAASYSAAHGHTTALLLSFLSTTYYLSHVSTLLPISLLLLYLPCLVGRGRFPLALPAVGPSLGSPSLQPI